MGAPHRSLTMVSPLPANRWFAWAGRLPHMAQPPWKSMTPFERVMIKTTAGSDGCLLYMGKRANGYGVLSVNGNRDTRATRVVAEHAYGPPPFDGAYVLHSCDNPPCVNPEHLRWGTGAENTKDALDRNRIARGQRHGMARLVEEQVLAIRMDQRLYRDIAEEYGVSKRTIGEIKRGQSWAHLGHTVGPGSNVVGERSGSARLTEEQVRAIRADPRRLQSVADEYGVTEANIRSIKKRRTWRHVTDH